MATAAKDGLIARTRPSSEAPAASAPASAMLDTTTVVALAEVIDPRLRCLVLLGGFLGIRTGELCGLRRQDVDLLHRVVRVRRQAEEISGHRIVGGPKWSETGIRRVALPKALVPLLEAHLATYGGPGPDGSRLHAEVRSTAWPSRAIGCVGARPWPRSERLRAYVSTTYATAALPPSPARLARKELMATIGHANLVAALRDQRATEERNRAQPTHRTASSPARGSHQERQKHHHGPGLPGLKLRRVPEAAIRTWADTGARRWVRDCLLLAPF